MPSNNHTPNAALSQFIAGEVFKFLQDYNLDMQKIDAFLKPTLQQVANYTPPAQDALLDIVKEGGDLTAGFLRLLVGTQMASLYVAAKTEENASSATTSSPPDSVFEVAPGLDPRVTMTPDIKEAFRKNVATPYSTTETLTGETWIDGKPIYRKVFLSVPMPQVVTNGAEVRSTFTFTGVDTPIRCWGMVDTGSDAKTTIPLNSITYTSIGCGYSKSAQFIFILSSYTGANSYVPIIILEYTKE